ncbi:MAG TPA: hypothetical protein PKH78_04895 [Candidatus Obscuribacter sp.]|nr:hypothetical protein [Candidatus Obscuribacter sp.]MBK9280376.1 hypothetical protein [Candidatus Obscuribacter sp.]HNN62351.1 hypothetical protein [Candidatus Obscuribacter sp.]
MRLLVVGFLWMKGLFAVLVKYLDRSASESRNSMMPSSVLSARLQKLQAERESLEWQLAIAEELGVAPDTLNALQAQIEQLELPKVSLPVSPQSSPAQTEAPACLTLESMDDVKAVQAPG